jgi:hypothetical protein
MEKTLPNTTHKQRGADRRVCTQLAPPPYHTRDGKVLNDRRSAFDRRATWIRECSLDTSRSPIF